jgi:hypothetical protein
MVCLSLPVFGMGSGKPKPSAASQAKAAEQPPPEPEMPKDWRDLSQAERDEKMMKAFALAFPKAIERAEFRISPEGTGDWAVLLKGTWYYCAEGRLLPEKLLPEKDKYARQNFYTYFAGMPEWTPPTAEQAERFKNILPSRRANPVYRSPDFFDDLFDAHSRTESWDNVVKVRFLDWAVLIHKDIEAPLAKVEARIREAAKTDPQVAAWIDGIGSIGAWNWREIAATASRSNHAYGTALDILPERIRGLHTYWQWTSDNDIEWYNVPYSQRYAPPPPVIEAFEAYGFCWGGKWLLFDTMHFEYRPEIMLMHNLPLEK